MTVDELIACGVSPTAARAFAQPMTAACERFGISTPRRKAAFLAQAMHESAKFSVLEENLHYSTPERVRAVFPSRVLSLDAARPLVRNPQALANRVYSDRLGNGSEASGDGWRYRGRGIFQLTGRANYAAAEQALDSPYIAQPELVAQPLHAALTAGWFWDRGRLNAPAEDGDIDAITRAINGRAMLGRRERAELYLAALDVLA